MNVFAMIQQKKEQFRDASIEKRKQQAIKESNEIIREKRRQAELAKIEGVRVTEQRDLERIKAFNERARGPSKVKKFGQGLAKVMNKGKEGMSSAKSQGYFKGINVPGSSGSSGLNNAPTGSPFGGQRPLDVGGKGLFNTTQAEKPKEKRTTIIIKQ